MVIIDVGGERHTAERNCLLRYPTTRFQYASHPPNDKIKFFLILRTFKGIHSIFLVGNFLAINFSTI